MRGFTSEKIFSRLPALSCTDMAHPGVKLKLLDWRDPIFENETSLFSRKHSFMAETLNKSVKFSRPGQAVNTGDVKQSFEKANTINQKYILMISSNRYRFSLSSMVDVVNRPKKDEFRVPTNVHECTLAVQVSQRCCLSLRWQFGVIAFQSEHKVWDLRTGNPDLNNMGRSWNVSINLLPRMIVSQTWPKKKKIWMTNEWRQNGSTWVKPGSVNFTLAKEENTNRFVSPGGVVSRSNYASGI